MQYAYPPTLYLKSYYNIQNIYFTPSPGADRRRFPALLFLYFGRSAHGYAARP